MGNELTIGETCYVTDGAHAKVKRQESGILYLTSKNITNGELKLDKVDWISEVDFNKLFSNTTKSQRLLQTGDVLMGIIGTLGNAYLYKSDDKFGISSSVAILRADPTKLMPEFLYYIVTSEKFKRTVEAYKGGSVQGYTNIATLKSLPIPNVTLSEQKKAVTVLSSLDKKIQLNKQTNQTLEQMAQALFKSWFVDFDPVFDNLLASADFKLDNLETSLPDELKQKAQRRLAALNSLENAAQCKASLIALAHELQAQLPTKEATQSAVQAAKTPVKPNFNANPKILAQHASTHAHFTNEFEHSEQLGWIPKGWKQKYLSDLLEVKYGKDHKKLDDGKYPVYGSGGLMRYAESFLYEGESVLIPRKGTLSNIMHINGSFWTVDTMFYTIPKVPKVAKFMFYHLKALDFAAMNVGSAVPSMTTKVLNSLELLFPSVEVLYRFDRVIEDYFNKIDFNKLNINQLESLRNTLLPKLISGELQIPDIATDDETVD